MPEVFDESIEKIIEAMQKQRSRKRLFALEMLIEKRILQAGGTPIIEGNKAFFFYRNENEENISITGDWNNWKTDADIMQKVHPASSVYYLQKEFVIDSRLSYRFLTNSKGSFNDPGNPNNLQEVFGNNTFLRMPAYQEPAFLDKPGRGVPRGVIKELFIEDIFRGETFARNISVYIPNGLRLRGKVPFLFVHDGAEAMTIGRFLNLLDNLYYAEPHTQKTVVVFIPPVDRHGEYMLNPKFARWSVKAIVPQVEKYLRLSSSKELRTICGASLGGLIASYTGFLYPNHFGNIAAQSASFWFDSKKIIREFSGRKKLPLRFYISTGTIYDALDGSREMLELLQRKGYDVTYRESNESHNWANWSAKYAEIIRWAGRTK